MKLQERKPTDGEDKTKTGADEFARVHGISNEAGGPSRMIIARLTGRAFLFLGF